MADADHLDIFFLASEQLAYGLGLGAYGACRSLLHEDVAVLAVFEREQHQIHSLVEAHDKSRHRRLGQRNRIAAPNLLYPQRDNRTPRAHHVAVTGTANLCLAGETALGDCNLFLNSLCDTHCIYRICGLVGGQTDNSAYTCLNCGSKYVVCTYNIGFYRLHREELARRHLLEGGCMKDIIHAGHNAAAAFERAHVADKELDFVSRFGIAHLILVAHIVLLFLVARENADFFDICG